MTSLVPHQGQGSRHPEDPGVTEGRWGHQLAGRRAVLLCLLLGSVFWWVNQFHVNLRAPYGSSEWSVSIPVQRAPEIFDDQTISGAYVRRLPAYADRLGFWLAQTLGLDAPALDKARLLVITLLIAATVGAIGRSLGMETGAILLGLTLVFSSVFTHLGRYLSLALTFTPTHSAVGFATSLGAIGLIFRSRYRLAALVLGLLVNYHPTHALIVSLLLGAALLSRRRETGIRTWLETAVLGALGALPLVVLVLWSHPETLAFLEDRSEELWWSLLRARTTNLFPLADGPLVLLLNWGVLALGWHLNLRWVRERSLPRREAEIIAVIWYWCLGLWVLGILFSDVWPVPGLARLALTRVTPYALILTALGVAASLWGSRHRYPRTKAALVAGLIFFPWIPLEGKAEYFATPLMAVTALVVLEQFSARLWTSVGVLAVGAPVVGFLALVVGGSWEDLERLRAHLGTAPLAEGALLATLGLILVARCADGRGAVASSASPVTRTAVAVALLCASGVASLALRVASVAAHERMGREAWVAVQRWANQASTPDSMFIVDPTSSGFETYSERPVFLDWLGSMAPLYVPELTEGVVMRAHLLGVDVVDSRSYHNASVLQLILGRARKNAFARALSRAYPSAAIANLACIRTAAPRVGYLVARQDQVAALNVRLPVVYRNDVYLVFQVDGAGEGEARC